MTLYTTRFALCSAALALSLTTARAQVVVPVYANNPSGDTIVGAGGGVTVPIGASGWYYTNVRATATEGISPALPRSGDGSVAMNSTSAAGKGDVEYYANLGTLGSLNSLSYDYYRSSSSAVNNILAPALRILVDADGNLGTTNDQGYFVFEPVYNNNNSAVATDQWVHTDVFNYNGAGQSANVWLRQFGKGTDEVYNRTLQGWISGQTDPGFAQFSANSLVYGLSSGIGSGWSGTFDGAIDNINIGFNGADSNTYNFELQPAATPEPGSMALLASLGIAGSMVARRRARRK